VAASLKPTVQQLLNLHLRPPISVGASVVKKLQ
jgi:hypothetical protein